MVDYTGPCRVPTSSWIPTERTLFFRELKCCLALCFLSLPQTCARLPQLSVTQACACQTVGGGFWPFKSLHGVLRSFAHCFPRLPLDSSPLVADLHRPTTNISGNHQANDKKLPNIYILSLAGGQQDRNSGLACN